MNFKKFLIERHQLDAADIDFDSDEGKHLLKLLSTSYSHAFNNKTKLYRGTKKKREWPYQEVRKVFSGERAEQGDKPISIQTMAEICPDWDKFPNRLNATILSTSHSEAFGFSDNVYWVLPKNGAKLGVAPSDFNYFHDWPFNKKYLKLDWFRTLFNSFLTQIYLALKSTPENLDKLVERLDTTDKFVRLWFETNRELVVHQFTEKYKGKSNILDDIVKKCMKDGKIHFGLRRHFITSNAEKIMNVLEKEFGGDLEKMLKTFFCPIENDFSICTIKELDQAKKTSKSEIWTEATCLYIDHVNMDQVQKYYRNVYGKK